MVPTYIADLIPPLVRDVSGYSLRNKNIYSTPFTRTNVSPRSSLPSAIRMWNNLDEGLKNQPTISSFKNNLKLLLSTPHLEKIHLSVLHSRIRNHCSNLNNDLFNNHLRDNPLCIWFNETEDDEHYFFHCNKYKNERNIFFEIDIDFQPLTMNILLYGNATSDMRHFIWVFAVCQTTPLGFLVLKGYLAESELLSKSQAYVAFQ